MYSTNEIVETHERQRANSSAYDKALLSISSAFVGLPMTNIEQLKKQPGSWCVFMAFIFFALTIVWVLYSFNKSTTLQEKANGVSRSEQLSEQERIDQTKKISDEMNSINNTSGFLFIGGVTSLVIFWFINLVL